MFNSSSSVRHCRSQKQLWDQTCLAEGCFCPYGRTSSACVLFTTRCTPLVAELFPWPDRNKQPCSPSQDFGNQVHANNLSTNLRCALQEARRFTGVGMVIQAQKKNYWCKLAEFMLMKMPQAYTHSISQHAKYDEHACSCRPSGHHCRVGELVGLDSTGFWANWHVGVSSCPITTPPIAPHLWTGGAQGQKSI